MGGRRTHEGLPPVEYLIRDARITDVERMSALLAATSDQPGAGGPAAPRAADLLRQLIHLPHAAVYVADARRAVVGMAVLALRPSVRERGFVGDLDVLLVDPEYESSGVRDSLIEETVRSARNKGCVVLEADQPVDPGEQGRWRRHGFSDAGSRLARRLVPAGSARQ